MKDDISNEEPFGSDVREISHSIMSGMAKMIFFAAFLFFVFTCVFGVMITESMDMYPSIRAGDALFYYRLGTLSCQDTVVYKSGGKLFVGRVQAKEGDNISVTENHELTVNGTVQPVQERAGIFYRTFDTALSCDYPMLLRENEFYILGDQRESAEDSRKMGPIKRRDIKGKVFMVIRRRAI